MINNEEEKGRLESLEDELYKRDSGIKYKRKKLPKQEFEVKKTWDKNYPAFRPKDRKSFSSKLIRKFLIASIIFFIAALGIAIYNIFISPRIVDPSNIEILIQGPVSAAGGEEVTLEYHIINSNNVSLEASNLKIVYPEGTRDADTSSPLVRSDKSFGPMLPGESEVLSINVIFFGEENTEMKIQMVLEYRIEGSSGTFSKNKTYSIFLTSSPVSLSVKIPPEVNSGQEIDILLEVASNSNNIINDFITVVDYPFGFEFKSAKPSPTFGDNVWRLGDLEPGRKKVIKITGKIEGAENEVKSFKISSGVADKVDERDIGVLYNFLIESLSIQGSFVSINFVLNGDSSSPFIVVDSGDRIKAQIEWTNNLSTRLLNADLEISISGAVLNEQTVFVDKGLFYRSIDNTITWNQNIDRTLSIIEPGGVRRAKFSFETHSLYGAGGHLFRRPEVKLNLTLRGTRVSEGFGGEPLLFEVEKVIRVNTALQLASYGLYNTGPFSNTGPIPPVVDQETTYTIVWSLINSSNDLSGVEVFATLPPSVRWLDRVSTTLSQVSFNPLTGEILWSVESLPLGTGFAGPPKKIEFQVGFTPSISQVGEEPTILLSTTVQGKDEFTGVLISITKNPINTVLSEDPTFEKAGGKVQSN